MNYHLPGETRSLSDPYKRGADHKCYRQSSVRALYHRIICFPYHREHRDPVNLSTPTAPVCRPRAQLHKKRTPSDLYAIQCSHIYYVKIECLVTVWVPDVSSCSWTHSLQFLWTSNVMGRYGDVMGIRSSGFRTLSLLLVDNMSHDLRLTITLVCPGSKM